MTAIDRGDSSDLQLGYVSCRQNLRWQKTTFKMRFTTTLALLSSITVGCVAKTAYPTVTAHGMGDSCFNSGMKRCVFEPQPISLPS
jgi:hypothetical protein